MGCDIHPYLEYYDAEEAAHSPSTTWTNCFAYNIDMGRNYTLFNALAGVRGMGDCPVDPRGMPDNPGLSYEVFSAFYQKIVDVVPDKISHFSVFDCSLISREDADKYIKQYHLKELEHKGDKYIPNVDFHTPSHLFLSDLIAVRRKYLLDIMDMDSVYKGKRRKEAIKTLNGSNDYELMKMCFPELECPRLNAIIASMIAIENSGPFKSRFVFWFDS